MKDRLFFWEYVQKSPGHKFTLQIWKWVVVFYIGTNSHKFGKFYFETVSHVPFKEEEALEARIRELERALNQIYHYTDCTTYQIEIINEVCPQTVG